MQGHPFGSGLGHRCWVILLGTGLGHTVGGRSSLLVFT